MCIGISTHIIEGGERSNNHSVMNGIREFKKTVPMPSQKEQREIARQERNAKRAAKEKEQSEQNRELFQITVQNRKRHFNEIDRVSLQEKESVIKKRKKQVQTAVITQSIPASIPSPSSPDKGTTPAKVFQPSTSDFSDTRPSVLRSRKEWTRIKKRGILVAEHEKLSGKTWDKRTERILLEGRK